MVTMLALACTGRVSVPLALTVGLLVYCSYLIDFVGEINQFKPELASARTRLLARRRHLLLLGGAALLGAMVLTGAFAGALLAASLLLYPIAVVLYGLPVLSRLPWRFTRLKDVPYLKAFYVACFWALLAPFTLAFLGLHRPGTALGHAVLLFVRTFMSINLCDLKDVERDRQAGVRTLVLALGETRLLRWLRGMNLLTLPLLLGLVLAGAVPPAMLFLGLTLGWFALALRLMERRAAEPEFICAIFVDGEWILWPAYLLLGMWLLDPG